MKQHWNLKVHGKVQGVYFRATAKEKADDLGITGFARNEPDETVYIEAEGEPEKLEKFREWCRLGPDKAFVTKVDTSEGEVQGFEQFETEPGS